MKKWKLALDIDGTITSNPDFFKDLTEKFKDIAEIHIITFRSKKYQFETIRQLQEFGIIYDYLVFVENKKEYIVEKGITIYFDDMDEFINDLPESVTVFKIREQGNFDYEQQKWLYNNKTGRNIRLNYEIK